MPDTLLDAREINVYDTVSEFILAEKKNHIGINVQHTEVKYDKCYILNIYKVFGEFKCQSSSLGKCEAIFSHY